MMFQFQFILAMSTLASLTTKVLGFYIPQGSEFGGKRSIEERDGVVHTIFEHDATGATIDYVKNSGICETTPGVNQYSGYFSVGSMSHDSSPVPYPVVKNNGLLASRKHEHVVLVLRISTRC